VFFDKGGDIAVGDQATNSLVIHYRKVTDVSPLQGGPALEEARFGPTCGYGRGHHITEEGRSRIALLGNDPSQEVPFREDAKSVNVSNQEGAKLKPVHHERCVEDRLVGIHRDNARSFLGKNVLSCGHVVPWSVGRRRKSDTYDWMRPSALLGLD